MTETIREMHKAGKAMRARDLAGKTAVGTFAVTYFTGSGTKKSLHLICPWDVLSDSLVVSATKHDDAAVVTG